MYIYCKLIVFCDILAFKFLFRHVTVLLDQLDTSESQWENVAQHILDCNDTLPKSERAETFRRIKEFYFGENNISLKNVIKVS